MDALVLDPEARFSCKGCGDCCSMPWKVPVTADEQARILALDLAGAGLPEQPFEGGALRKRDQGACILLGEDRLCRLHAAFGEASKPLVCRRFPYQHVASAEQVWVTASFGSRGVREGGGQPLSAEHARAVFAKDIDEAEPGVGTRYPLRSGEDVTGDEVEACFEGLIEQMGRDDVFQAASVLAGFVARRPAERGPRVGPMELGGEVRYAFALTLYSDILDQESAWERLKGVFRLPRALEFRLTYDSRLLGRELDMARIARHAGTLPLESHQLLVRWLRGKLRGRVVFQDVDHAGAGVTRTLLQLAAALYLSRAQAQDREIVHEDTVLALRQVELFIAWQHVVKALAALDPRLRGFWSDPQVALDAARLFDPGLA